MLEYAGDDASYHSDPGKGVCSAAAGAATVGGGVAVAATVTQQSMASDEVQPLWTAQLRASLTQIYEKCSVQVPTPLQRPAHLRPLLQSTSDLEASSKSEHGPQSSESDLSNNVA